MKNFKKKLIFVLIIIILAVLCYVIYSNTKVYTKNEVISLLEKGMKQDNYTVELSNENQSLIMKQKNNIYVVTSSKENEETFKIYENFDLDKLIIMDEEYAIKDSISNFLENEKNNEYLEPYLNPIIKKFKSDDYQFSFIEKLKYNNENCILVNLKSEKNTLYNANYTISTKTGLVYKIDNLSILNNVKESNTFNIILNSVNDSDIEEPDLTNFKVYEK